MTNSMKVWCPVIDNPNPLEHKAVPAPGSLCLICSGTGRCTVDRACDFIEQHDIELPENFYEAPESGKEDCAFCHGSGDIDHDENWSSPCLYCNGRGSTGPIEAELIRRQLAKDCMPMSATQDDRSDRPSHLVHNFSTFDTGEIGFIVKADDPNDGPYFWYLVDPAAHNMQGEVLASGRCNGIEHGTEVMHSAIMGFISKLNPTHTPDRPAATFDAPYVER